MKTPKTKNMPTVAEQQMLRIIARLPQALVKVAQSRIQKAKETGPSDPLRQEQMYLIAGMCLALAEAIAIAPLPIRPVKSEKA